MFDSVQWAVDHKLFNFFSVLFSSSHPGILGSSIKIMKIEECVQKWLQILNINIITFSVTTETLTDPTVNNALIINAHNKAG